MEKRYAWINLGLTISMFVVAGINPKYSLVIVGAIVLAMMINVFLAVKNR